MSGRMARNKGQRGERELAALLAPFVVDVEVKRNIDQVREGGADIICIPGLCIEVKRQEQLALPAWWKQVCTAARANEVPVLAYRQNRKQWVYCLPAHLLVPGNAGFMQVNEGVFIPWFQRHLEEL